MFGGTFVPQGWALCAGQQIPVSQNPALFAVIGTTYGGDGINNFAVPNLLNRTPVGMGTSPADGQYYAMGDKRGYDHIPLQDNQLPWHNHTLTVSTDRARASTAAGNYPGDSRDSYYTNKGGTQTLALNALTPAGGNDTHENRQPSLTVMFIIALEGIFPPHS